MNKGLFITIEGIEGVGKSTNLNFLHQHLSDKRIKVVCTREPGGTIIAESIRQILLSHHNEVMTAETELLLLFAGRAQHVASVIKPALRKGDWVICDRFTDASYAYQGWGRGLSLKKISALTQLILDNFVPDLTLLLDAPVETSLKRLVQRGKKDRIEQEDINFFQRVREGYLALAQQFPQRFHVISANHPLEQVQSQIVHALEPFFVTLIK